MKPKNMGINNFLRSNSLKNADYKGTVLNWYRRLAIFLLVAILMGAVSYGITVITFLFNKSWAVPVIMSKSDPHVAQLAAQVFQARQNYDKMESELGIAKKAHKLLQIQRDALRDIIARYEQALNAEKVATQKYSSKLQALSADKIVINAKNARLVENSLPTAASIDKSLNAGLITTTTAIQMRTAALGLEASLADGNLAAAALLNQIGQLNRGVHSLAGGNSSPEAIQSIAQVNLLRQQLNETELKLLELDSDVKTKTKDTAELGAMLSSLKASPYYITAYGAKTVNRFAFVPYENEDSARIGAPVFSCKLEIVLCFQVGTIKTVTTEEERLQHPLYNTLVRGVLVELDLGENQAAKDKVLFVGSRPFVII